MRAFLDSQESLNNSSNGSHGHEPPASLRELAAEAGVEFNGDSIWDIQVHDPAVYSMIMTRGSLGFGEAYMKGLWDCRAMDMMFTRLLGADLHNKLTSFSHLPLMISIIWQHIFNLQSITRAFQVGELHYDIGNDVFEVMLDKTMSYSCGYWEHAENLEEAQLNKLEMICRKLELKQGERLLDIGCGWGGLAMYAARYYGVDVVGVTVSKEQANMARERCEGLPVEIILADYRELTGEYDKVVSVGMFEHVGPRNYGVFFEKVMKLLGDEGLFLLHTIGTDKSQLWWDDPWIDKYIFRNGKLPSAKQITKALEGRFLIEDWHNFGQDYDKTLMSWWNNFDQAWDSLSENYDRVFYRMWKFYLLSCAGFFRARRGQLWQLVMSKRQRQAVYRSVR